MSADRDFINILRTKTVPGSISRWQMLWWKSRRKTNVMTPMGESGCTRHWSWNSLKMLIFQVNALFIVSWKRLVWTIIPDGNQTELRKKTVKPGSQYTSRIYREAICKYGIRQSMNSAGGRCHDNARCESMWARMKSELLYDRYDTEKMTTDELKTLIWRYFISYWNNRRICSANGGLPPMVKRQQYYNFLKEAA